METDPNHVSASFAHGRIGSFYPMVQEAERRALAECGDECHVVMRFSGECAAFAADQEEDSTVHGWAKGYDSSAGAS